MIKCKQTEKCLRPGILFGPSPYPKDVLQTQYASVLFARSAHSAFEEDLKDERI